jgi:hypothetical protein
VVGCGVFSLASDIIVAHGFLHPMDSVRKFTNKNRLKSGKGEDTIANAH